MPSSTSSSDRLSGGRSLLAFVCALVLSVGIAGGLELRLRMRGDTPSAFDDANRWAMTRWQVRNLDPNEIVIVGTSRASNDLDLDTFAEVFGRKPVQLAIAGSNPSRMMQEMIDDEQFTGTLIVDVVHWDFYEGKAFMNGVSQRSIDWSKRHGVLSPFEVGLRVAAAEHLSTLHPQLAPLTELQGLWAQPRASDGIVRTYSADRSSRVDFSNADPQELERIARGWLAETKGRIAPSTGWQASLATTRDLVMKLRARGGDVAFVTFPVSGKLEASYDTRFPRSTYWDPLIQETSAAAVHYTDSPSLSRFRCPDESHLDTADRRAFTLALATMLKARLDRWRGRL